MRNWQRFISAAGVAGLMAGGAATAAQGQLLITEIQSNQNVGSTEDWFEVTNFGASVVDLTDYYYNDDDGLKDTPLNGAFQFTNLISINPGESIVFVENMSAAAFRGWWGIDDSVQVHTFSGSGLGLGQNDAVTFFDANGDLVASLDYSAGGFTRSDGTLSTGGHAGPSAGASEVYISLVWDPASGIDEPRYTFAQEGVLGGIKSPFGLDTGSPGVVPEPGSLALLGLGGLAMLGRRRHRRA